jgi:hypothetical protein
MLGRDFYSFHLSDRTYERAEFGRFAIALPVKQFAIMVLGVLALTLLTVMTGKGLGHGVQREMLNRSTVVTVWPAGDFCFWHLYSN